MIELKYATDLQGELDLMKMCNCFSCKRAIDLIERIDGLMGEVAARAAAPAAELQHGIDCPKAAHIEGRCDYLHDANDDRPFDGGETTFCGRCHYWMGCPVENVIESERRRSSMISKVVTVEMLSGVIRRMHRNESISDEDTRVLAAVMLASCGREPVELPSRCGRPWHSYMEEHGAEEYAAQNIYQEGSGPIHAPECAPAPCEYCGPVCYNGAAHNARVEDGVKWIATSAEQEDALVTLIETILRIPSHLSLMWKIHHVKAIQIAAAVRTAIAAEQKERV
jgi:hypothetical protein